MYSFHSLRFRPIQENIRYMTLLYSLTATQSVHVSKGSYYFSRHLLHHSFMDDVWLRDERWHTAHLTQMTCCRSSTDTLHTVTVNLARFRLQLQHLWLSENCARSLCLPRQYVLAWRRCTPLNELGKRKSTTYS